jgi:hypothetical protein
MNGNCFLRNVVLKGKKTLQTNGEEISSVSVRYICGEQKKSNGSRKKIRGMSYGLHLVRQSAK